MRATPYRSVAKPEISRFPCKEHTRMPGSQTAQGRSGTRSSVPTRIAFRSNDSVGTLDEVTFAAQWLAYPHPCQRFVTRLAAIPHA